jgi:histone-binding protein RBBP4
VFIQNTLPATSHSVQWLPFQEQDPDYPAFNKKFFLLGTHPNEEVEVEEMLYVASVRVPKLGKSNVIDYTRLPKDLSQVKVVKKFKHQGEVSKARSMKQDWKQIASILNTGEISLYHYDKPEATGKLTGLEEEGFGIAWSPFKNGLLAGATGQRICLWDVNANKSASSSKVDAAH